MLQPVWVRSRLPSRPHSRRNIWQREILVGPRSARSPPNRMEGHTLPTRRAHTAFFLREARRRWDGKAEATGCDRRGGGRGAVPREISEFLYTYKCHVCCWGTMGVAGFHGLLDNSTILLYTTTTLHSCTHRAKIDTKYKCCPRDFGKCRYVRNHPCQAHGGPAIGKLSFVTFHRPGCQAQLRG